MNGAGLVVEGLSVGYRLPLGTLAALADVDMAIAPGETMALVGESGSGKSTLAWAIMRYLSANAVVAGGRIVFAGENLLAADASRLRRLRGGTIGMVYQDPSAALNPTMRLGRQLCEAIETHRGLAGAATERAALELLSRVQLADPASIMRRFPHEVSGGEKQRVVIAMALAGAPQLMIFDEPTTALDATTAIGIVDLIRAVAAQSKVAALYITHDLGNVARLAQRVSVIYAGRIVEQGPVAEVLARPLHPYTRMLLASRPNPFRPGPRRRVATLGGTLPDLVAPPLGCIFAARCPHAAESCSRERVPLRPVEGRRVACVRLDAVAGSTGVAAIAGATESAAPRRGDLLLRAEAITVDYGRKGLLEAVLDRGRRRVSAVAEVDLAIRAGETVGLVGESGCGKSTLARALVGLVPAIGHLRLAGGHDGPPSPLPRSYRRAVQIVFQHPDQSLNPRMTAGEIVARPLALHEDLRGAALRARTEALLERVRLPAGHARRYPHELSGGEKQRVAIARAFAPNPRLVICDEITSSLDVSVQGAILNLLADLQDELGTSYLFISHDLNLVQHIADRILVMYLGRIVEERAVAQGPLPPPYHPYAEALLGAMPMPEPGIVARPVRLAGALPSPADPPPGCRFHTRCPRKLGAICETTPPPHREFAGAQRIACHIAPEALAAVPPIAGWDADLRQGAN
jgi:peptide/nickel transport system ATP-binding protein